MATVQKTLALAMLGICAYTDMKRRVVILPYIGAFAALSLLFHLMHGDGNAMDILLGTIPGWILLFISRLSGGKLGEGDAYIIMALGVMLGSYVSILILAIGLILAALAGSIMMIVVHKDKSYHMPFIPYVLAGYITMLCINQNCWV